jgi:CBS domain-containing protein
MGASLSKSKARSDRSPSDDFIRRHSLDAIAGPTRDAIAAGIRHFRSLRAYAEHASKAAARIEPNGPNPIAEGAELVTFDPVEDEPPLQGLASKVEVFEMSTIVREVMTSPVVSVRRTTSLKDVARLLVEHRISGLPVVDIDGTVLGVVSEADFLWKESGESAVAHRPLARILGESKSSRSKLDKVHATRAADAMTAPAITIGSDRPLAEATRLMAIHKVNRLPVVDDGILVGIITRADVVRAFVRSDQQLEETIKQDVILRILWFDPSSFGVHVKDGIAKITGHVERRSTVDIFVQAIAAVPGVVDVDASITWSVDDREAQPRAVDAGMLYPIGPR